MRAIPSFLSKTIKGGLFFLVPVTLVIILVGKVLLLLKPLGQFISRIIDPDDRFTFDLAYTISILMLVLVCFLSGLVAASRVGKAFVKWIENNIMILFPGYQYMKNMAQSATGFETGQNYPVVLVLVDGWMIAFLMNELPDNTAVVFVPGSPDPWSGDVMMFDKSEIKETSLTQREALSFLRRTGLGLKDLKIDKRDKSSQINS
jgi:uncharacterized membrane protein